MTLLVTLVLVCFVASVHETLSAPATYDQQQTGDLNVRVELENIEIVALMSGGLLDGFGDYDYSYDYSDFTIKPITSPAPNSPSSSTPSVEPWHTWPTVAPSPAPTTVSETGGENPPKESETIGSELESESGNAKPEKNPSSTSSAPVESPAAIANATAVETPVLAAASPSPSPSALPEPEAIPTPETTGVIAKDKTGPGEDPSEDKEVVIAGVPAPAEPQTASSEKNPTSAPVEGNSEALTADQAQSQSSGKKCNPGSTRDQEGRCRRVHTRRRIPASFLPFGIRLTPKIHNRLRDHQSETVEN